MSERDGRDPKRGGRTASPSLGRLFYGGGLFGLGACLGIVFGSFSDTPRILLERLRGPVATLELPVPDEESEPTPPLEEFGSLADSKSPVRRQIDVPPLPPTEAPMPPPVASAPVAAAPAATPPKPSAAPAKPAPTPAPKAAPAPSTGARGVVVQIASHVDRKAAQVDVDKLRAKGFDAYLSAPASSTGRFRVRVRPAGTESASALAARLKGAGFATWVTAE